MSNKRRKVFRTMPFHKSFDKEAETYFDEVRDKVGLQNETEPSDEDNDDATMCSREFIKAFVPLY